MQYDRTIIGRQAKELGFVRDTFEKVCRLTDVLNFISEDTFLSDRLALKGGTAINLTVFDLPRLSVDIDLDFCKNIDREKMITERKNITEHIDKFMSASGYSLSRKSKQYHALDSFVYEYINSGGAKDNIKIEINYMLRCHVFPLAKRQVKLPWIKKDVNVLCLDPTEIFSSKIVALLSRTAPRDLYDIYNMQKYENPDENKKSLMRKCTVFYSAIARENAPEYFEFDNILKLDQHRIKTDLIPVLRSRENFNVKVAQEITIDYLKAFLIPEKDELDFWMEFNQKNYRPELIFLKKS